MVLLSRGCPEHPVRNLNIWALQTSVGIWLLSIFGSVFVIFFFSFYLIPLLLPQLGHNIQMCLPMSLQERASHVSGGLLPFILTYQHTFDRWKQLAPRIFDDASLFGKIYFRSHSAYSTSHSER